MKKLDNTVCNPSIYKMKMIIRKEEPGDVQTIRGIPVEAFGTEAEANLVDALRSSGVPIIFLVAEEDGIVRGHISFSPVMLVGGSPGISLAGLAPMAVLPEYQRRGIGSKLVENGLQLCRQAGYAAVVVLGHPGYYSRFGFIPSARYGITSEYAVPEELFMVKELRDGVLSGQKGIIKYHEAFRDK